MQTRFRIYILLLILGVGLQTSVAAQNSTQVLIPVLSLLLDNDPCIKLISVGHTTVDQLDPKCPSEFQAGSIASYYSFSHAGGPLHIDLLSGFPNSFDTLLVLRKGEGRRGMLVESNDDGHEDFRGSRIIQANLPAGRYSIEATAFSVSVTKADFVMSVYSNKVDATATGLLNDTGIAYSSDLTTNGASCTSAGSLDHQDCNYGRDNDGLIGRSESANDDDGADGFSFLKVSSTGGPLPANAPAWSCVKDNVTGLMWEVKTDNMTADLYDKDWDYTWYSTDNSINAGNNGTIDGGTCFAGVSCDIQGYVAAVNAAGLCGYNDWRMPSPEELRGIINYNLPGPQPDSAFFPNHSGDFWTAYARGTNNAWKLVFTGSINSGFKNSSFYARLVRGN